MIKCDSGNISSDCTSYGHVMTDCVTVGAFVEEAVKTYSHVTFRINDSTFTVKGHGGEFKYESYAMIESVDYTCGWTDEITFIIKTKPKTVRREGWVRVFKKNDGTRQLVTGGAIYKTKDEVKIGLKDSYGVIVAHIEWEEVAQ